MSITDGRWQLGVVEFYDSFEHFDQFTSVGSAYTTPTTRVGNSLVLNSTVASDYTVSPFYLHGQPSGSSNIPGSIIIVGPSSNASWDGAIERTLVNGVSSYTVDMPTLFRSSPLAPLYASYVVGDQVLIRTVPLGWTCVSTPKSANYCISPIERYDDAFLLWRYDGSDNRTTVDSVGAYKQFKQYGVRIATDSATETSGRSIYLITPVNSIDTRIRKFRASWYYRLAMASAHYTTTPSSVNAKIHAQAMSANGVLLSTLTGEATDGVPTGTLKAYSSADISTDWTFSESSFSFYSQDDPSASYPADWRLVATGSDVSPNNIARTNRLQVNISLLSGINTAFDLDDLVIEHAHGTSGEASGYLEIPSWPERDSIAIGTRTGQTTSSYILADGTMVRYNSAARAKKKYTVRADFPNATTQTLQDMQTLINWQDTGRMIALRTYDDALPEVIVGHLNIENIKHTIPSLNYCSFTLTMDEA